MLFLYRMRHVFSSLCPLILPIDCDGLNSAFPVFSGNQEETFFVSHELNTKAFWRIHA
ncbi:hypothetical protein BRW83_1474 [Oxalobacter formigenes]|nr:hypothetical protein BRW83_1474 [Oxalobacter formigenes]